MATDVVLQPLWEYFLCSIGRSFSHIPSIAKWLTWFFSFARPPHFFKIRARNSFFLFYDGLAVEFFLVFLRICRKLFYGISPFCPSNSKIGGAEKMRFLAWALELLCSWANYQIAAKGDLSLPEFSEKSN
jgi:hypothetical protein